MLARIIYALRNGWRYRKQLQRFLRDPSLQLTSVEKLSLKNLANLGIKVLVLDYDGVLAGHGEPQPRADLLPWLLQLPGQFNPGKIFVLSNKPTVGREKFFAERLPGITFIMPRRKKPYPDGLQQILEICNVAPAELLLVDDRLLTGMLATLLAGTRGLWITRPYINIMARPFTEFGFIVIRWFERTILRII